jgi:hypothetical protein
VLTGWSTTRVFTCCRLTAREDSERARRTWEERVAPLLRRRGLKVLAREGAARQAAIGTEAGGGGRQIRSHGWGGEVT